MDYFETNVIVSI